VDCEVIVVDDCSSDRTPKFLARCKGLISARNKRNSGFIDTCNRGAELASGEFLVFLNNDTTLTPGWLDALIEVFERDRRAGIVGARLVYPDGRLQEAGGIIFSDGSGWNYGREQQPDSPQYAFVSEADYVSGACLAIRADDFRALGGFDTRFRPAYYEDTDLCFQIRAKGKKVIYQPASVVIHHEGATSGTDESSGAKRYQAINREKFQEKWTAVLAEQPENAPDFERADPVRAQRYWRKPKRVLVIDAAIPQPDHDSGSVRMLAMLTLLSEMGYQVSFLPENLQFVNGYSQALQQAGIEVLSAPTIGSIEAWLSEHGPDLDLLMGSRHYVLAPLMDLIGQHCQRALRVFDTVDLHFLREEREAEISGSAERLAQAAATRAQELGLIQATDITLVVSPVEQQLLVELIPGADVRIVSNIHDVHGRGRGWDARQGLMFVGGFQHVPNVDAALWLVEEIFPRIRAEIPDIELHLIGSRMPPQIRDIDQPGVQVHGFVADLDPYLEKCRVSLAPLRYGAGVKGKVNQAMSHGLPVVATACAAEGMFLKHGVDVLVADSAEGFAAEVVRVYGEAELWQRLSEGGLANVAEHFSREAAARALATIDAEVGKRLAG
jgi:O-antigen biosynthesis protein